MHVLHVVGARPNFMKAAPVFRALQERAGVHQRLLHTGQHYDDAMSTRFFDDLGLPVPDVNLQVGSASHALQTARMMEGIEAELSRSRPDHVVVYGDVNSTLAAAVVAVKLGIPVAHVEAGLRSRDLAMPEEINRLLVDRVATHLYTPSEDANYNLLREGVESSAIHFVGNVMIDTLTKLLPRANASALLERTGVGSKNFVLVTLHRPSNVDDNRMLSDLVGVLVDVARRCSVVFPVHPRTRQRLDAGLQSVPGFYMTEPVSYLEFLDLQRRATLVVTDSGGVQEETTFLRVPCLTVRTSTERPITITLGTNQLVGQDPRALFHAANRVLDGDRKQGKVPPLWDGHAAERIAAHLRSL